MNILIFPLILVISASIGNAQGGIQLFPNEWRSLAKRNQNHPHHGHHRHHGQNAQEAHHTAVNRQKMSHFRQNYYSLLTKREREIVEKFETELLNGEMTWRDFEWMINNIDGLKAKLNGKIGGGGNRQNGRAKWQEGKSANYWAQMRRTKKQQHLRQRQQHQQWGRGGGGGGGWQRQNGAYGYGGYGYGAGGGNGGDWTPGMAGGQQQQFGGRRWRK